MEFSLELLTVCLILVALKIGLEKAIKMGNCFSSNKEDSRVKMSRVSSKYTEPNRSFNLPTAPKDLPQASGGEGPGASSSVQAEEARLARLEAAEKRANNNKNRGVQNGGGKLSNKLAEERGKKQAPQAHEGVEQLDWRAD